MAKPYSNDLRERVVGAVLTNGLSRHQAAEQFGVSISVAIKWVTLFQATGSVAPGQMGGHKPKRRSLSEDHAQRRSCRGGLTSGPSGAAWSVLGGLTAPIFHGGSLEANRRGAQDAYDAAFAQYQQTVLAAFQQVADNIHGLSNAADAVNAEQQALDSAGAALRLARLG